MPTYRWIIEQGAGSELSGSIDYTAAYNGGRSIALAGKIATKESNKIKLYQTKAKIEKNMTFTTTAKATDRTNLDLVLEFEDGTSETFKGNKKVTNDWTTVVYHLNKATDKVVTSISYELSSFADNDEYALNFGQIVAAPQGKVSSSNIENPVIEDIKFDEERIHAGIRLMWDSTHPEQNSHYEIYRVLENGERSFIGATSAQTHFIDALERQGESITGIEIVPVDLYGKQGQPSQIVTFEWPQMQPPKASFSVSKTIIAPGEEIEFTNTSSANTQSVQWSFEGASIESSQDQNPVVTYSKEGVYDVQLTAINEAGETTNRMKGIVTVTNEALNGLALLSKDAKAEASSYVNEAEAPKFAVDGDLGTKWCATGSAPYVLTVDLGSLKTVSEIRMAHAAAGGESPSMNTRAYTLELSKDGTNFHEVSRTASNSDGNTINTFAAASARFIRLTVNQPTQGADSAVRLYEFEAYGLTK